jgi:predicted TIM-barrel fold metal-dependent hydrolase
MTNKDQTKGRAAEIRAQLSHPVIDADGHWLFPTPVFYDFLRDIGGPSMLERAQKVDGYSSSHRPGRSDEGKWVFAAPVQWMSVNESRDWATAQLPGLFHDRLDEFGIDVSFVYPTSVAMYIPEPDLRRAYVRAYNTMAAELFAPFGDRIIPVAVLPSHTPSELIEEAEFVKKELGFRAVVMNGTIRRPSGPGVDPKGTLVPGQASRIDSLALDSPYDYEPVWDKFEELGLAVTTHGGSLGWDNRISPTNYSLNHLGHFAQANQTFARTLFLGGVPQRHPRLRFLFLEGGVAWAANLLVDLIGHWEKRSRNAMLTHFAPDRLAKDEVRELFRTYGASTFKEHLDEMCRDDMLSALNPHMTLEQLTERVTEFDFDHLSISSRTELRELFSRSFAFGCEADDPMTKLAFDRSLTKTELRVTLGSDISHWDVIKMNEVLVEAYECVDDGLLDEGQFKNFVYGNAIGVHTALNPHTFDGTIIEDDVRQELERSHVSDKAG